MTNKLEQAARQALEALENAPIEYDFHGNPMDVEFGQQLYKAITALREALAEQEKPLYRKVLREMLDAHEQAEQEPVAWIELLREARDNCKASIVEEGISATRKEYRIDLEARLSAALNAAPVQQVEQEPVAEVVSEHTHGEYESIKKLVDYRLPCRTKLYAAPVRTKDLTEQEIQDAIINISPTGTGYFLRIARAVIAADREKNK